MRHSGGIAGILEVVLDEERGWRPTLCPMSWLSHTEGRKSEWMWTLDW